MAYSAEISRANPTCLMFLIDQSGSMQDDWGGEPGKKKADAVALYMNSLLQNLVLRATKSEGIRNYYDIGILGYGASVGPALGGALAGRDLVAISEIGSNPSRIEERTKKVEDGVGGLVDQTVRVPVWVDPVANYATPMCQALTRAGDILTRWVAEHPASFPPIVINVTDGESTDGDPTDAMQAIQRLSTNDGNVLLFNIHISSTRSDPIRYPATDTSLPDQYAQLLFQNSSPMPDFMRSVALQEGFPVTEGSRGFVFNADPVSFIQFIDIGTRPSNLR